MYAGIDHNPVEHNPHSPCREVRLGTASMAASAGDGSGEAGGPFIDSSRLDLRRYARRPSLAMVLADYLIFVERNPRKVCVLLPSAAVYTRWTAASHCSFHTTGMCHGDTHLK